MKHTLIFIGLLSIPFIGSSQKGRLNYADRMYDSKSYYYASEGYEDVLDRKTDSLTVAVKIADSYDKIGNTQKAVEWYTFLKTKGQLSKEQHLRLALLERELENYAGSEQLLASYQQQYGTDAVSKDILSSGPVSGLQIDKHQFELKEQGVNTTSSDMSVSYYAANEVLLASSKRRSKAVMRLHTWTGNYFYDIYKAPVNDQGEIGKMKLMKSKAKTKFHDGPAVYSEQTGYVYFTRNNYLNGKKQTDENKTVRLKIYRAQIDGRKFKNIEELSINDNNYSTAHPTITKDGKRLYFSSDRPGGYGGMDLYYVNLDMEGKPVGSIINLGEKVNTTQHELFPSYNAAENLLFFSSEGHFGLGGLDVFVAKLDKQGSTRSIENVGSPINSAYDDFSFTNDDLQTKGYFTSNRKGGKGDDDIYGFSQKFAIKNSASLKGTATDILTKKELPNTMIYLADKNGNVVDSTQTDERGAYELSLAGIEGDFRLLGSKTDYIKTDKAISYDDTKTEYEEDLALMPVLDYYFTGTVKDKATQQLLSGVNIMVTDTKKNEGFAQVSTTGEGSFKTETLPYGYNDQIAYSFKLEKEGYVSKNVSLSELLSMQQELEVNGRLSLDMTKIEIGKTDLNDIIEINPIYFDLNKSDIRSDAAVELNKIVKVMQENPGMVIELGSHTDSRGSDASNRSLSDRRAKSSAKYIISQGISKDRIYGKGYGESKLKISDAQINKATSVEEKEALHQKNRRTEFIIVKMK